jgi:cytidine deaminase
MKYCGGTFSSYKATLCAEETTVVGHRCTYEGRLPDDGRIAKILNWGPCTDLSNVCAFLGTIGVCRMFIRNFAHHANPLTMLTQRDQPFLFGLEQIAAQDDLKQALVNSPAL